MVLWSLLLIVLASEGRLCYGDVQFDVAKVTSEGVALASLHEPLANFGCRSLAACAVTCMTDYRCVGFTVTASITPGGGRRCRCHSAIDVPTDGVQEQDARLYHFLQRTEQGAEADKMSPGSGTVLMTASTRLTSPTPLTENTSTKTTLLTSPTTTTTTAGTSSTTTTAGTSTTTTTTTTTAGTSTSTSTTTTAGTSTSTTTTDGTSTTTTAGTSTTTTAGTSSTTTTAGTSTTTTAGTSTTTPASTSTTTAGTSTTITTTTTTPASTSTTSTATTSPATPDAWLSEFCFWNNSFCRTYDPNSICLSGFRCVCHPAFFYSTSKNACVAVCSEDVVLNDTVQYPCLYTNTSSPLTGVSLDECRAHCYADVSCRSFSYWRTHNSSCYLYVVERTSPISPTSLSFQSWFSYDCNVYVRKCA